MSAADYDCPQCDGRLAADGMDEFVCEDCGLNVTEVLEHVADRDGPLSDIARQLRKGMDDE